MKGFLLDTSALLALRDDEPGGERVAALLGDASAGGRACHGCFISLMEVFYHESPSLLETAARIKATRSLSLADAWIAAAAREVGAVLVHKDPEFENLPDLPQERLPYKP